MIQIVRDPGGEQLSQGDGAEFRVLAAAIEIRLGELQRGQRSDALGARRRELVEQAGKPAAARMLELREAIELVEGPGVAMFQDDPRGIQSVCSP